jgi:hypothetical protein
MPVSSPWGSTSLVQRSLLFVALVLCIFGGAASAGAQSVVDPTSCGHFDTWEDAQAALEDPETPNPEHLDPDDDGVACESAFGVGDGDIPADQMTCSDFENQGEAQAHYDAASESQQDILDPDGDGVACEEFGEVVREAPSDQPAVAELPSTGSGSAAGSSETNLLVGVAAAMMLVAGSTAYRLGAVRSR